MAKRRIKYVYFFGAGRTEGRAEMRQLLGGKGANLAEMACLGLPVPPGFTITAEACDQFYKQGQKWPKGLAEEIQKNLALLEKVLGKSFGRGDNPLLVSVRSGAAVSMPGMMDTVLNLGLHDQSLRALVRLTGDERFAWDAYRRLMQMFGDVVLSIEKDAFEHELEEVKRRWGRDRGIEGIEQLAHEALNKKVPDTALGVGELQEVVRRYKQVYERAGKSFPQGAWQQLAAAIDAVFGSWHNDRAVKYRQLHDIRGLMGTAVNVQTMVFGNMGEDSGTGVAFTRDPATGTNRFYGEYLMKAQGEDVVAGIRTPQPIATLSRVDRKSYRQLLDIRQTLERRYRDMQDVEFTIERGKLYMLQTRAGKRTAAAAVKIAVDMMRRGLITEKEAVVRVEPEALEQLLHPTFDPAAETAAEQIGSGLPASPGAATGQIVFNADDAEAGAAEGKPVILVRIETSPEDIGGMNAAKGILTSRGGMTSHAAVVARGMGKCCVAGAGGTVIDYAAKTLTADGRLLREGDWISLNGSTGTVYAGRIKTVDPALTGPFGTIMKLADKYRKLGVRTNADTPHDTEVAVRFGAEGIGLTRTEHMFFEGDRIISMRKMILAEDEKGRKKALEELLPLQRNDFIGIFKALKGRPATIRLLDPPLHEFLPQDDAGQQEMAQAMGVPAEKIKTLVQSMHELNPMLGLRGCRLGITNPEITAMQARAIIEAAFEVPGCQPEIMVPLVGNAKELDHQKQIILAVLADVMAEKKVRKPPFDLRIGTMVEVPRGALTADEVAEHADFFSFGTNDLTQMGCGFSRDDAGKFLKPYVDMGIYERDPFQSLDTSGVGELVRIAVEKGRKARPNIKLGICGEHGGDPASIEFCHKVGLTYVSCSPYRVPVARLAAAQAAIKDDMEKRTARRTARKKTSKRKKPAKRKTARKKATRKKSRRR